MNRPATNYVKVSILASRDLTDDDSIGERKANPSSGLYTTTWIYPFRGHSYDDGLRAFRTAEAKRRRLRIENPDIPPSEFQLSAFAPMPKAASKMSIALPVVGEVAWTSLELN